MTESFGLNDYLCEKPYPFLFLKDYSRKRKTSRKNIVKDFVVVQWFGVHLQGTQVCSLDQEGSTCHRTAKPVLHNC